MKNKCEPKTIEEGRKENQFIILYCYNFRFYNWNNVCDNSLDMKKKKSKRKEKIITINASDVIDFSKLSPEVRRKKIKEAIFKE